ncbi:MAG: ribonuclease III [Alphaproteobacteria bacterium]|nr:ribonuclease III [Alphaproteobacteria bacterium]
MSAHAVSYDDLYRALGHRFAEPALLTRALRHSSVDSDASYERLEFLGDRVLGLVVAELLLERFPDENEGEVGRRFAALVQAGTLAQVGRDLQLGRYAQTGPGVLNDSILADMVEAVVAAVYRDGGMAAAREVVRAIWDPLVETRSRPPRDAKTALQEWAQAKAIGLPSYHDVDRTGPDHAPEFTVEVRVDGVMPQRATGTSKRAAEQDAAAAMLEDLGIARNG